MKQRTRLLLLILNQIGLPLIQAVSKPNTKNFGDDNIAGNANRLAELLSLSTEFGLDIAKTLDLNDDEKGNKAIRIALSSLSGQIIASQYGAIGKTPDNNDLKRITLAIESVLTYADKFTPDEESIERLQSLADDYALFDGNQINLLYIQSFIPVINAVNEFAFGQTESKLLQDISERLKERAKSLRAKLPGEDMEENESRLADLSILKMLIDIYADCHISETARILELDDKEIGSVNIEPVWSKFDQRVQMLETLALGFVSTKPKTGTPSSPQPEPPEVEVSPQDTEAIEQNEGQVRNQVAEQQDNSENNSKEGEEEDTQGEATGTGGASPMSFFKKE